MTSEVERRPAPVAPAITGAVAALAASTGSAASSARRCATRVARSSLIAILLGLLLIGVSFAIVQEFDTPASRQQLVDRRRGRAARSSQGLAGKAVNVGTLGGYLQYKYGTFFPIIVEPLVDPRPVRRRWPPRRGAAAWSSSPRRRRSPPPDRAREAVRPT